MKNSGEWPILLLLKVNKKGGHRGPPLLNQKPPVTRGFVIESTIPK